MRRGFFLSLLLVFCFVGNVSAAEWLEWPQKKTAVPVDKVWTVTFNQPVSQLSINSNNFCVTNQSGTQIPTTVNLSADGKSVFIDANPDYEPGQEYTLSILETVESAVGKPIKQPVRMTFSTAPATPISPTKFAGSGKDFTSKAQFEEGLLIVNYRHSGERNFIVWMLNDKGEKQKLIANEIGSCNGRSAFKIVFAGDYLFDVTADGSWEIEFSQPIPVAELNTPTTIIGTGNTVSKFINMKSGLTTFEIKHNGESNFIVWLLNSKGEHTKLIANEIGVFSGNKAIGMSSAGIYLLDIEADGKWLIKINQ